MDNRKNEDTTSTMQYGKDWILLRIRVEPSIQKRLEEVARRETARRGPQFARFTVSDVVRNAIRRALLEFEAGRGFQEDTRRVIHETPPKKRKRIAVWSLLTPNFILPKKP